MIHTKFYCTPDGCLHMAMEGHAGRELVCAGASALACTLGGAVERMYEQSMLRRCPRVELESGRAEIIAHPKPPFARDAALVFWTAQLGLAALAEAFPENVGMEETMRVGELGRAAAPAGIECTSAKTYNFQLRP